MERNNRDVSLKRLKRLNPNPNHQIKKRQVSALLLDLTVNDRIRWKADVQNIQLEGLLYTESGRS